MHSVFCSSRVSCSAADEFPFQSFQTETSLMFRALRSPRRRKKKTARSGFENVGKKSIGLRRNSLVIALIEIKMDSTRVANDKLAMNMTDCSLFECHEQSNKVQISAANETFTSNRHSSSVLLGPSLLNSMIFWQPNQFTPGWGLAHATRLRCLG